MNNGVKAEKENTPNEANLQEEEVLTEWLCAVAGATRDPSRAFPPVRAAGRARARALVPGRRSPGAGNCPRL